MNDFFVGQAVVCVDAGTINGLSTVCPELEEKKVYTIREVGVWNASVPNGSEKTVGVKLQEVSRPSLVNFQGRRSITDGYYSHLRFRPVEYKAMSVFREIARTTKLPQRSKKQILEEA